MIIQPNAAVYPYGRTPARSLDAFFSENRAGGQTFTVDPMRRTTIVGSRGTRLTIPPNAFLDASGWPVRETVSLYLHEVFTRPQMILSGLTNTSEDRILESAGQIRLQAEAEEQQLQLSSSIGIDLPLQTGVDNPLATQLFSGGISQTASFGSGFHFDWKVKPSNTIQLKTLGDKKYLHFLIDDLNWWNCTSFFHRKRSRIMMSVRWSSADQPVGDLAAFLLFRDFNAVVRMYPGRHGFSSWNIPKDLFARTILIGIAEEQMLIGASDWSNTSSRPMLIELASADKEEVIKRVVEWSE